MLTAVVILGIITVAVTVHELAHYLNARSVGVPVRAFSVGFGPVLWRRLWRGTEWRVSALPLGGYVDMPGLGAEPDEHGTLRAPTEGFAAVGPLAKLWILVGGVIANFILAILLLATVLTVEPTYRAAFAGVDVTERGAVFAGVVPDSIAEGLGIEAGDVVLRINDVENPSRPDVMQQIREAERLELTLLRDGQTVAVARDWPPAGVDSPLLGVQIAPLEIDAPQSLGFGASLVEATSFFVRIVPETVSSFGRGVAQTFSGQRSEEIAGPVGLVRITNQATQAGWVQVLLIAALINFSLAIFNLLPIPALDGGRMLLVIVTAIRGRPFRPGQEEMIHYFGFLALIGFMVLITFAELGDLIPRGG